MMNSNKKLLPITKKDIVKAIIRVFIFSLIFVCVAILYMTVFSSNKNFVFKDDILKLCLLMFMFVSILAVVYFFIYVEMRTALKKAKLQILIFSVILLCVLSSIVLGYTVNHYARPIALAGLLVAILITRKAGIFINMISCIMMFMLDAYVIGASAAFLPFVVGLVGGTFTIIMISLTSSRYKAMYFSLLMIPFYVLPMVLVEGFSTSLMVGNVWLKILGASLSPVFSFVIYTAILPLFEKGFNIITSFRLMELTDQNKGLLKRLAKEATGTFNHSLTVANLAGACALAIGEDFRLARACALYHDIGKLYNPIYFKENQTDYNPHDELTPELSTNFIKKHATYGVELIQKNHLPEEFARVCVEHHGTLPIKYFLAKAQKFTESVPDVSDYCYDGPIPRSKISAIIMIADASEAVIRTFTDNRSRIRVDDAVRGIIEERMELEQFDDCDITFNDLNIIRKTIVDSIAGIFHERIEYPKIKVVKNKDKEN